MSCMAYYAYHFMVRSKFFNHLPRSRDLFYQFAIDMYAKIESERLLYSRINETQLHVDNYMHLHEGINNDRNGMNISQLCILPSTFIGGPPYMHEQMQDAMTHVKHYRKPDLFFTCTCNPKWAEVGRAVFQDQTGQDRQDILARVFHQKVIRLMELITKRTIFGPVRCCMYMIEWQKRENFYMLIFPFGSAQKSPQIK